MTGKLIPFLEVVIACTSIFTIIGISIERFRVVYRPLSVTDFSYPPTLRSILFIWCLAICISLPIFSIIVFKEAHMLDGTPVHVCRMPVTTNWQKCYVIVYSVLVYVVPVVLLSVLYANVIRQLNSTTRHSIEFNDGYRCNEERYRIRRQVIHIIICVVIVFFICHLPFRVITLFFIFSDTKTLIDLGLESYLSLLNYSRCLLYLNHALNPILYNFVSTKFRIAFKFLFFTSSRSSSINRHKSPGACHTQNHRIVFKRTDQVAQGEQQSQKRKEKESGSTDSQKGNNDRILFSPLLACNSNPSAGDDARLLVAEENIPCKWTDECIKLDLKDKSSAKVRFIMTKDGYVIGITLQKLKVEDKNVQTYQ